MPDFTSSLYLGLRHESYTLPAWNAFSSGQPSVLAEPKGALQVCGSLAQLQGCEDATLAPSTLHLFWDLIAALTRGKAAAVFLDAGSYPIARWGAERARLHGAQVVRFGHQDAEALRRRMARTRLRPVVVADGICPDCGRIAPLREYVSAVEEHGGTLVIDDTQALGILGSPVTRHPWGRGGGGSLRHHHVHSARVLLVSSLAKAFGAPVAALSGSRSAMEQFREISDTRVHCSPPSVPVILAAEHALQINRERGDAMRDALLMNIRKLRRGAEACGLRAEPGWFPVQTFRAPETLDLRRIHSNLRRIGFQTLLRQERGNLRARLSVIVTAAHRPRDVDDLLEAMAQTIGRGTMAGRQQWVTA